MTQPSTIAGRVTQAEAGRILGISRQAVHLRVARGTLTAHDDGTLDEAQVRSEVPGVRQRREPGAAAVKARVDAAPVDAPAEAKPADVVLQAKRDVELIKAERAKLEWARDRGLMLDREAAVRLFADFGHHIRRELQSHPRKMQAAMVRHIRCGKCGAGIEGKIIAIEAERYVAQLLKSLADNPLGGL